MEAEVNSPSVEVGSGEELRHGHAWYPTRMGEDFKTTTWAGVYGKPLTANRTDAGLVLSGNSGCSMPAIWWPIFTKGNGRDTIKVMSATPTEPVQLRTTIQAPPNTAGSLVHLVDSTGLDRGPLGEVLVNVLPARDGKTPRQ